LTKTRLPGLYTFVANSVGLALVNLTQLTSKPVVLCVITRSDGYRAFQGHSMSPSYVPIESVSKLSHHHHIGQTITFHRWFLYLPPSLRNFASKTTSVASPRTVWTSTAKDMDVNSLA